MNEKSKTITARAAGYGYTKRRIPTDLTIDYLTSH